MQGVVEIGSGEGGGEQVIRPAAEFVGYEPGDLVGLIPLLGLVVATDGGGDEDTGDAVWDPVDGPGRLFEFTLEPELPSAVALE